jgi:CMP/dCMP kinase
MKPCEKPFVITINHQIGSGAAYIGEKLAERLSIPYIDREILRVVAQKLHLAESELEGREEHLNSFWESFGRVLEVLDPAQSIAADRYNPTDQELFQTESETILKIAGNSQAVFMGRCCGYILRDHPCRFSLLVHADRPARVQRLRSLYSISQAEAEKLIAANDRERSAYIHTFTKQDWLDARSYDLCLNTSSTGLDQALEIIHQAILAKVAS